MAGQPLPRPPSGAPLQLRLHPAAERELHDALQRSAAEFGPWTASRLQLRIAHIGERLAADPGIGTRSPGEARMLPLGRFPYSLVYRVDGDVLTVLALMHQSRKPGYWRDRR